MSDQIDLQEVMRRLPHRFPFLLIDRVIEHEPDKRIVALKNVTINEPFFPGHFPGFPVMPGVLILESMAQACGLLASLTSGKDDGCTILLFTGANKVKFRRQVEPGDQLRIEAQVLRRSRGMWRFSVTVTVDGRRTCVGELMCAEHEL